MSVAQIWARQNYCELDASGETRRPGKAPRAAPLPGDKALDIFWDKRIREAGKDGAAFAAVSKSPKTRRQGPVQLDSNYGFNVALASFIFYLGRCRRWFAFGGRCLLVRQCLCTRAGFACAR